MSYSVFFNGYDLSEYLNVLVGFTPYIGADWQPEINNMDGIKNGGDFQYQKFGTKTIPMPFLMQNSLKEKYDSLQKILNVSEPKLLIFGNQPDRYYLAVPSGNLNYEQLCAKGEGTITWIIPDGRAHACEEKIFPAAVENGILKARIINGGTGETPINYKITMNDENGYIGIVSQYGVIQMGQIQEADGMNYQQNETLISGIQEILNAPDDHGTNYMHPDHDMSGTLGYTSNSGGIVIESMGSGSPGKWCGGMRTISIPQDSEGNAGAKNFWCYMNWWFQTAYMGQTGEQSIAFLTADNKVICGYSLYKTDMSGNTAALEFWLNGKIVATKTFTPSDNQMANPFDGPRGNQDIRKEGDKVTYYWFGSYNPYTDSAVKDMVCTKIQIAFTQYYGRNIDPNSQYVTRNCLRNLIFQKMNVDKWQDVPNRYAAGDVVEVNGEDTKIYKNGLNITGDEVTGSTYFLSPPGVTEVEFYYSDFCDTPPTIEASIREVFL